MPNVLPLFVTIVRTALITVIAWSFVISSGRKDGLQGYLVMKYCLSHLQDGLACQTNKHVCREESSTENCTWLDEKLRLSECFFFKCEMSTQTLDTIWYGFELRHVIKLSLGEYCKHRAGLYTCCFWLYLACIFSDFILLLVGDK